MSCAVALAVFLTLADLQTVDDGDPVGSVTYIAAGTAGVCLAVAAAGWHSLWLIPVVTIGFAALYQAAFWTAPPGLRASIDTLGYFPISVVFELPLWMLLAAVLAGVRSAWRVAGARRRQNHHQAVD